MTKKEDYASLTGAEKVAIFMLALSEEQAVDLLQKFEEDEIRQISQIMANLGVVASTTLERVFADYTEAMHSPASLVGTFETTERLLTKILDKEKVNQIMEDIRGPAGRTMWDKLSNVNEAVLASYLKNEYPQTVAVVLTKIGSDNAARVLGQLPDGFATEVIMRMLTMDAVQKDVLMDVERTLRTEFMSTLGRTNRRDSHEMMADIFNRLDRKSEARLFASLERENADSAERIRTLMFTFDDLVTLNPMSIQALIREVDKEKMTLALKGANDNVKEFFFSNMTERASKMLKEDLQALGPVRLKDVDEAQVAIVELAKTLAAKGQIVIGANKGDDDQYIL